MDFSARLRDLLDERDMKQKELAAIMGIPASTLGGYMQGTSEPDFAVLKRLADFFNVSTDYLLDHHTEDVRSENEHEIIRIFRSLSDEQKDLFIEQGKAFIKVNAKRNAKLSHSTASNSQNKVG